MATNTISSATTTDFSNSVPDFVVQSMALDIASSDGETFVYYDKTSENFGYYYNHPQVASRTNALCTWAFGQGYTSENNNTIIDLRGISGNGKETFSTIIWNHANVKLGHGDEF